MLFRILEAHSDYKIAYSVRSGDKGAKVASQYSKLGLVCGNFGYAALLEEEAKRADIVLSENNLQLREKHPD